MSIKENVATLFTAIMVLGGGIFVLTFIFLTGWGIGYKQSISSEHFYEQKYQGVIQALVSEAKWCHVEIVRLQGVVYPKKSE